MESWKTKNLNIKDTNIYNFMEIEKITVQLYTYFKWYLKKFNKRDCAIGKRSDMAESRKNYVTFIMYYNPV